MWEVLLQVLTVVVPSPKGVGRAGPMPVFEKVCSLHVQPSAPAAAVCLPTFAVLT